MNAYTPRRPEGYRESADLEDTCLTVRCCLSALRLVKRQADSEILGAMQDLEAWLTKHDPRWREE